MKLEDSHFLRGNRLPSFGNSERGAGLRTDGRTDGSVTWNRALETRGHVPGSLIFDRDPRAIQGGEQSFQPTALGSRTPTREKERPGDPASRCPRNPTRSGRAHHRASQTRALGGRGRGRSRRPRAKARTRVRRQQHKKQQCGRHGSGTPRVSQNTLHPPESGEDDSGSEREHRRGSPASAPRPFPGTPGGAMATGRPDSGPWGWGAGSERAFPTEDRRAAQPRTRRGPASLPPSLRWGVSQPRRPGPTHRGHCVGMWTGTWSTPHPPTRPVVRSSSPNVTHGDHRSQSPRTAPPPR